MQFKLADFCPKGLGTESNIVSAVEVLKTTVKIGSVNPMLSSGYRNEQHHGGKIDMGNGASVFRKASSGAKKLIS